MNTRRLPLLLLALLIGLFLIANRAAYKAYFQDDDLDNISFTQIISLDDFWKGMVTPRFFENNFRPVGHFFYREMGFAFGLRFPPYILVLHLFHLGAAVLLWLLLRRLGLPLMAACAGVLLFAFEMSAFDIYWKPMYVFDLLCGFFCLASLLFYVQGRWLLSLLAFWIAFRAKEVVVFFPVVLAAYEILSGERRWKRLVPFFLISVVMGAQALLHDHKEPESAYTVHLDPAHLWQSLSFYASNFIGIPFAGFAVLLLLFKYRDRRVLFGLFAFAVLLLPLLMFPGRLFSAYLYVPFIGLSIALAAFFENQSPALVAAFFALWIPWNYAHLRTYRRAMLADAEERRLFIRKLQVFSQAMPEVLTFVYDNGPVNWYGTEGALRILHGRKKIEFARVDDPEAVKIMRSDRLVVLNWDPVRRELHPVTRNGPESDSAYVRMGPETPLWQLGQGWYGSEGAFRWTQPTATAYLRRPEGAKQFQLVVNIGPEYIAAIHRCHVAVALDGNGIGEQDFTEQGWQTARWNIPPAPAGPVEVTIRVSPEFHAGRVLGVAVGGFGFLVPERPDEQ
jgi:hypothetical protein